MNKTKDQQKENLKYFFDKTLEKIENLKKSIEKLQKEASETDFDESNLLKKPLPSEMVMIEMENFVNDGAIYRSITYKDQFNSLFYNYELVVEAMKNDENL